MVRVRVRMSVSEDQSVSMTTGGATPCAKGGMGKTGQAFTVENELH